MYIHRIKDERYRRYRECCVVETMFNNSNKIYNFRKFDSTAVKTEQQERVSIVVVYTLLQPTYHDIVVRTTFFREEEENAIACVPSVLCFVLRRRCSPTSRGVRTCACMYTQYWTMYYLVDEFAVFGVLLLCC